MAEIDLRRKLAYDVQMILAGHSAFVAASVTADVLASIVGFTATDLEEAEQVCEEIAAVLKSTIRENWTYLREVRAAAMPEAGRA